MEFTGLELEVLDWVARHVADPAVSRQLKAAVPVAREYTGAGFFLKLRVRDRDVPRTTLRASPVELHIMSPELSHGGGCMLYFDDGLIVTMELFAYVGDFPTELRERTLVKRSAESAC